MKKIAIITTVFIMSVWSVYSQNQNSQTAANQEKSGTHRIFIHLGSGYTNSIYDNLNESSLYKDYSTGSVLEVKYGYFFTQKWGAGIGLGLAHFAAQATLNNKGMLPHYNDPFFDPEGLQFYDLYYKFDNVVEKQQIWGLELPLQMHFEYLFHNQHGIMASLGVKGYFPVISAKTVFKGDSYIVTEGYEAFTDTWYETQPHFGKKEVSTTPKSVKLRCSADIIAEFGGIIHLNEKCNLYIGAYGSYGFLDILPKDSDKKDIITPENDNTFFTNHLLESNSLTEKWNRWQIGVKVGVHLKHFN